MMSKHCVSLTKKKFNITGNIIPEKHYYVDTTNKINQIIKKIENEEYFVISRPRQYGKTTTLFFLQKELNKREDYLTMLLDFEIMPDSAYDNEKGFITKLKLMMIKNLRTLNEIELIKILEQDKTEDLFDFSYTITNLCKSTNKKIVLLIDEVDKNAPTKVFINFLALLRSKYLNRTSETDKTFHSVILAGVSDIKTLKLRIRPDEEALPHSPWNIASEFNIDMSFSTEEIEQMINDYSKDKGIKYYPELSRDIRYWTDGYPFFVSFVCKVIDEEILPVKNGKEITKQDLETAIQKIIEKDSVANFDSLIKNLESNPDVDRLVKEIIIFDEKISYSPDFTPVRLGVIYGILKRGEYNKCEITNKIYEQRLYEYYTLKELKYNGGDRLIHYRENFETKDAGLDMGKILNKFQEFIKDNYSIKNNYIKTGEFLEVQSRWLFLAFIQPIINGRGFSFKEVQTSEEKRLDIVITYNKHKYVVELKIYKGQEQYKKGIEQLTDYLIRQNVDKGYLLVFDKNKKDINYFHSEWLTHNNKKIYAVWI